MSNDVTRKMKALESQLQASASPLISGSKDTTTNNEMTRKNVREAMLATLRPTFQNIDNELDIVVTRDPQDSSIMNIDFVPKTKLGKDIAQEIGRILNGPEPKKAPWEP